MACDEHILLLVFSVFVNCLHQVNRVIIWDWAKIYKALVLSKGLHLFIFAILGLASPFKPVMDTNYYYSGK